MLVHEAKLYGSQAQYGLLDEAIRTAQFVRNKALRLWMDLKGTSKANMSALCALLAKEFEWAAKLNSMARQASAERAWQAVAKFYDHCKKATPGKKGYPKFKKNGRSVEYKTSGWKLADDRTAITFTDGFNAGTFKFRGANLSGYAISLIKRIRVVRRADGYYAQFCVEVNRAEDLAPTGRTIGLDMGLESFYTDSNGEKVENPRYLRKAEKRLKQAQRKVSRKKKGSANRRKAIKALARKHLKISRQRKDFAIQTARCVVRSHDLIALEGLQVRNMVKNHNLAKSISDASWSLFRQWTEYFGKVFRRVVIAVPPHYTSQECSACHAIVKKSLSTRTHTCQCGCVLDRDQNAAINILAKVLKGRCPDCPESSEQQDPKNTGGHPEISTPGERPAATAEEQSNAAS